MLEDALHVGAVVALRRPVDDRAAGDREGDVGAAELRGAVDRRGELQALQRGEEVAVERDAGRAAEDGGNGSGGGGDALRGGEVGRGRVGLGDADTGDAGDENGGGSAKLIPALEILRMGSPLLDEW